MEAVLHEELREACTEGDLAAVRALILAGADVTAKHASTGVEPLDYAAFHGQWEVAQLLMRHGASPEHAVEEAQRGGFLPLAEYLRIRRARYQREAKAAADEAKRQKEGEVLARKARFQQQHNEREQRRRGELLAGQVQRAAEHNLLDEQRKEDKAARRAARQKLRKETLTRAAELAESNKDKWNKNNSRVAELNAQQKALEEEHRRAAAASRHHDFISGGGGRVPPGLSRDGLAHAPSGASSGFGSSSQLRSRLSIEALLAEEPSANLRVLEENQAKLVADLARREARREPVAAARRAAEAVAADEKWRAAQEKRERAARTSKGLGAQRQRVWKSKSDEHIARSEQLRRAQSDHELLVVQEIRRRDYDEGRQMRVKLNAKALANEQSRRELFHASHLVARGSPPGSPLAATRLGGGDAARFLPKPKPLSLSQIGSPSQTALPTRQSEARREASQGGPPSSGLRGPPPLPGGAVRLPPVLAQAARLGDEETLRSWLAESTRVPSTGVDAQSRTALHLAASHGHLGAVRLLLDAGTDPRVPDAALRTPLHGAVAAAHREVAQVLLHKGARAGAKDAKGRTPLLLARQLERGKGDEKLLSMLEYSIQGQAPAVPMGHGGLV